MDQAFKVVVAGRDRSADLGAELMAAAARRPDRGLSRCIADEAPVLALKTAVNEAEFLSRYLALVQSRNRIDTQRFETPAGAGALGRLATWFRLLRWRLFRYQHDWMAFRQNAINVSVAYQLEFERLAREKQIAELDERLRRIEAAAGTPQEPRP